MGSNNTAVERRTEGAGSPSLDSFHEDSSRPSLDLSFEPAGIVTSEILKPSALINDLAATLPAFLAPGWESVEFQKVLKGMGVNTAELDRLPLLQVPVSYVLPVIDGEPHLLCMRQSRSGKRYGLAGGKMRSDETPLETALREAKEEMGVSFKKKHAEFLAETHLAGYSTMWPIKKAEDHGYDIPSGALNLKGRVATIHPTQYFFATAMKRDDVPSRFDGREYKIIDITKQDERRLIHPRVLPIVQLWADVLLSVQLSGKMMQEFSVFGTEMQMSANSDSSVSKKSPKKASLARSKKTPQKASLAKKGKKKKK